MAKLGEVCKVSPSTKNIKRQGAWLLNLDMVEQQTGRVIEYKYVGEDDLNGSIIQFDTENVLYSKLRPNLNKVVLPPKDGFSTSELLPLRPDASVLNKDYLAAFLRSDSFVTWAVSKTAGAKMPRLGTKDLMNAEIPVPNIERQKEIAEKFKKLEQLISLRKQQLAKLDELVKARFVEMFGDPDQNPKGWPLVSITEIIRDKASNGFFAKRDAYKDDGNVQILGVSNVVNRMYSNTKELPRTNATQAEKEKYSVKYGDMLFCRSSLVADGIGKASIVAKGTFPNVLFECHVIRLSLDLQKCVPEFVQVLSTTPFFRRQIIAQSKTATMTTIGQDGILKSSVVLPPIDLQNQFAAFVERVDQQKQTVQQSLEKLELMKKALMQEYFG